MHSYIVAISSSCMLAMCLAIGCVHCGYATVATPSGRCARARILPVVIQLSAVFNPRRTLCIASRARVATHCRIVLADTTILACNSESLAAIYCSTVLCEMFVPEMPLRKQDLGHVWSLFARHWHCSHHIWINDKVQGEQGMLCVFPFLLIVRSMDTTD